MDGSKLLFTPTEPGAYIVQVDDAPALASVAVNVDVLESDVRPGQGLAQLQSAIRPDQVLRRIQMGPYLLFFVLAGFILQSIWSLKGRS